MSHCKKYHPADFSRKSAQAGTALVTGSASPKRFSTDTPASDPVIEQLRQRRIAALDARLRAQQKTTPT